MKKGKKKYIIIIVILIIYLLLMYMFIGKDNIRNSKTNTTLVVGNSTIWSYSNKNWYNMKDSNKPSLNWQKFNVYVDGKKFGKYFMVLDDKWYLFDNNKKAVNYVGNLFAYQSNYDMNPLEFESMPITDFSYVNQVLGNYNIVTNDFTFSNVTSIDFDHDGINEDFYVVTNAFKNDPIPDKYFSIVFMVKENNIYMVYKNTNIKNFYSGCIPHINAFINVDTDSTHEVIVSCDKYSIQGTVDMLYKYKDDKFQVLISNQ